MIYEYAIDPECDQNTLWQALSQFGIHRGRILGECPSNFRKKLKKAIQVAAGEDYDERDRLVAQFEQMLDEGWFIKRQGQESAYNNSKDTWIQKILPGHKRQPFRGLICDGPKELDCVLTKYDLRDANPFWFVDQTPIVQRTADDIAQAFAPLGRISTDLQIIDPYFGENPHGFASIPAIIDVSNCEHTPLQRVEIHTVHEPGRKDVSKIKNSIEHALGTEFRRTLPKSLPIRVFIWETVTDGDGFHDRYILTNLGGVGVSMGLDVGKNDGFGSHKNTIFLLSPKLYQLRKDQFDTDSVLHKRRISEGVIDYKLIEELELVHGRLQLRPCRKSRESFNG